MKTPKLLPALALAAASLLHFSAAHAQTWETVDEITPWRGRDIVADNDGRFISLAIDNSATGSTGVVSTAVSVSTNGGASWDTVGFIAGYALDLAVAPDGALFATGNRSDTVSGRAFLWQSLDHGATWTVIEPWAGQAGTFLCHDVAAGNTSSIYLCGSLSGGRWIVLKGDRTDSGITWTTVDNIGGNAHSICVRPSTISGEADEILVSGGALTIRRSIDGGATWATVDSYSMGIGDGGYSGVATGPDNSIYTVGRTVKTVSVTNETVVKKKVVTKVTTATEYGWLVRKSGNGGASWANVDYVANGCPGNGPITVDAFGRVFVAGFSTGPYNWLVRGSTDGGTTWVTTDPFTPTGATSAQAWGVASDTLGNVCVIGEASIGTLTVAPIRRLAAP